MRKIEETMRSNERFNLARIVVGFDFGGGHSVAFAQDHPHKWESRVTIVLSF